MEWLPIETLPKGQKAILYYPEQLGRNFHLEMIIIDYNNSHRKPTHWMPIPKAPRENPSS